MLFFDLYPGVTVNEGDKVLIDKSMLDATNLMTKQPESKRSSYEVWYQVTSFPKHGIIVVGERNLTKEKPNFSQFILNKYGITYHHDNSETTRDHFDFDVYLNLKSKPPTRPPRSLRGCVRIIQHHYNPHKWSTTCFEDQSSQPQSRSGRHRGYRTQPLKCGRPGQPTKWNPVHCD